MDKSSMSEKVIVLEMSHGEAEALARAIYLIGEHIAAGAPIPSNDQELNEHVGAIYRRLLAAIG
jgi:hypothetical protein